MKVARAKLLILTSVALSLGVVFATLLSTQRVAAAGETYEWSGQNIDAINGVFTLGPGNGAQFEFGPMSVDGRPRFIFIRTISIEPKADLAQDTSLGFAFSSTTNTFTATQSLELEINSGTQVIDSPGLFQLQCSFRFTITLTAVNQQGTPGTDGTPNIYSLGTISVENVGTGTVIQHGITQEDESGICRHVASNYGLTSTVEVRGTATDTIDEAIPDTIAGLTNNQCDETAQEDEDCKESCKATEGDFGWIICPASTMLVRAATGINNVILGLLTIDTQDIFATGPNVDAQDQKSSKLFRNAWSIFRNLAYALLIIIGLIMVVSQVAGLDLFDAYTIRKMLPKLVIAVIAIPLAWPLLNVLFNMANDLAFALQGLIENPFETPGVNDDTAAFIGSILSGVVGVGVVAIIGGWPLVLAAIGSALLAFFSALVIITARDLVAYILVIASPIAIACAVFEPFKKAFTIWRSLLTTIIMAVPAIAALLSAAKVGAIISMATDDDWSHIFALLFIIAGYAMFWTVFKQLDKVSGQLANGLNKVTGGLQNWLKKNRSEALQRGWQKTTQGRRFRNSNIVARRFNRLGNYVGGFLAANRMGLSTSLAAKALRAMGREEAMKEAAWKMYADQDDLHTAAQMAMDRKKWRRYLEDERHFEEGGRYHHLRNASDREKKAAIDRDVNMSAKEIMTSYLTESGRYSRMVMRDASGAIIRDSKGRVKLTDVGKKTLKNDLEIIRGAQRATGMSFARSTVAAKTTTGSGYGGEDGRAELMEDIMFATGNDMQERTELTIEAKGNMGQAGRSDAAVRLGAYMSTMADYEEAMAAAEAELAAAENSGDATRIAAAKAQIHEIRSKADSSIARAAKDQKSLVELMRGRPEQVKVILREAKRDLDDATIALRDAIISGDQAAIAEARRRLIQETAYHENALEAASYSAKEIAQEHADRLLNEPVVLAGYRYVPDPGNPGVMRRIYDDGLLRMLADAPQFLPERVRVEVQNYMDVQRFSALPPQDQHNAVVSWQQYEAEQQRRAQMPPAQVQQLPPLAPPTLPRPPRTGRILQVGTDPSGQPVFGYEPPQTPSEITLTERELQLALAARSMAGLDGDAYGQMRRNFGGQQYMSEEMRRERMGLTIQ